jgi:hypothetical protein
VDKPNVEKLVIGWLNDHPNISWPVSGKIPKTRPEAFLIVSRVRGGREAMVLDAAEIRIDVYHQKSQEMCSDEANRIADMVPELKQIESITHVEVNSVLEVPDTTNQYERYQIYCDVHNRR